MKAKQIADHEGFGHLETGWYDGIPFKSVTINPAPGTATGARGVCYAGRPGGNTAEAHTPEILTAAKAHMLLAGRVADELFHPSAPAISWCKDFEDLAALMPLDNTTLQMHRYCEEHPGDTEGFYQKFKKPVVRLLKSKRGRRAGKALSDALLEAGTLSGAAAVSILEKAWGKPLPPKAIPASKHIALIDEGPNSYEDVLFHLGAYLHVMEEDANRLRGDLPGEEESHLGRIRFYLKMLGLELNAKIKNRGPDHKQVCFKAESLPASRREATGKITPKRNRVTP